MKALIVRAMAVLAFAALLWAQDPFQKFDDPQTTVKAQQQLIEQLTKENMNLRVTQAKLLIVIEEARGRIRELEAKQPAAPPEQGEKE